MNQAFGFYKFVVKVRHEKRKRQSFLNGGNKYHRVCIMGCLHIFPFS